MLIRKPGKENAENDIRRKKKKESLPGLKYNVEMRQFCGDATMLLNLKAQRHECLGNTKKKKLKECSREL